MKGCCSESGCRRKKPFLIRQGVFSGRVYLVTDYTDRGGDVIEAKAKHDITDEFNHAMAAAMAAAAKGATVRVLDTLDEIGGEES